MDARNVFERVNFTATVNQNAFLAFLNDTISELKAKFGDKYIFISDASPEIINTIDDGMNIYDDYYLPLVDNVLYMVTNDDKHKTDFVNHAKAAYQAVWRKVHPARERYREREVW